MKLIFCNDCHDLVNLYTPGLHRKCFCGKTSGMYVNSAIAEISGPCTPIGVYNSDFLRAVSRAKTINKIESKDKFRQLQGDLNFKAFAICEKHSNTIIRRKTNDSI